MWFFSPQDVFVAPEGFNELLLGTLTARPESGVVSPHFPPKRKLSDVTKRKTKEAESSDFCKYWHLSKHVLQPQNDVEHRACHHAPKKDATEKSWEVRSGSKAGCKWVQIQPLSKGGSTALLPRKEETPTGELPRWTRNSWSTKFPSHWEKPWESGLRLSWDMDWFKFSYPVNLQMSTFNAKRQAVQQRFPNGYKNHPGTRIQDRFLDAQLDQVSAVLGPWWCPALLSCSVNQWHSSTHRHFYLLTLLLSRQTRSLP